MAEKLPLVCTVAAKVCVLPALSTTVNVTMAPAGRFVVPEMVGVALFSGVNSSRFSSGDVMSITPELSRTDVLLPASSMAVASTLYEPSARALGTSTAKFPAASTVAVTV